MDRQASRSVRITAWPLVALASLALTERVAGAYLRNATGAWSWTRTTAAPAQAAPAGEDPVRTKMVLHPYFGSNTVRGLRFDTL